MTRKASVVMTPGIISHRNSLEPFAITLGKVFPFLHVVRARSCALAQGWH